MEDVAELVGFGFLLELGAGVGNCDKPASCLFRADGLLHLVKKVLLENVGLKSCARLAGDNEQGFREINFLFCSFHLRGVG